MKAIFELYVIFDASLRNHPYFWRHRMVTHRITVKDESCIMPEFNNFITKRLPAIFSDITGLYKIDTQRITIIKEDGDYIDYPIDNNYMFNDFANGI